MRICSRCHRKIYDGEIHYSGTDRLGNYFMHCSDCSRDLKNQEFQKAHNDAMEAEARRARYAQEALAEEERKNASMNRYTCCRCQGSFRADYGYSAVQSPIKKPVCRSCYSDLIKCFSCNGYGWKDEAIDISGSVFYKRKNNGIEKSQLSRKTYVCSNCKLDYKCNQEKLKHEFTSLRKCFCCGGDLWKEESLDVTNANYYQRTENGIKQNTLSKETFVCPNCKSAFLDEQKQLEHEYTSLRKCFCCGNDLWKEESLDVSDSLYYEEKENSVERRKLIGETFVCPKCKDDFSAKQKNLALKYETLLPTKEKIVVACDGSGDASNITDALKFPNCKEILVKAGLYKECVKIKQKVAITGEEGATIWNDTTKEKAVIVIDAEGVVIKKLTIMGSRGDRNEKYSYPDRPENVDDVDWWPSCIRIKRSCILQGLNISYSANKGIFCIGNGADSKIIDCRIEKNCGQGVVFYGSDRGVLENCDILENSLSGIDLLGNAVATIKGCKIHDGKAFGVCCKGNSLCSIENCDVFKNTYSGIIAYGKSNVNVKECRVYRGKQVGILCYGNSQSTIENCSIYENAFAGIESRESAHVTAKSCEIRNGMQSGVYCHGESHCTMDNCDVFKNVYAGISVHENATLLATNCKIHHGKKSGLFVCDTKKQVFAQDCSILDNVPFDVDSFNCSPPLFDNCSIGCKISGTVKIKKNGVFVEKNFTPGNFLIAGEANPSGKDHSLAIILLSLFVLIAAAIAYVIL